MENTSGFETENKPSPNTSRGRYAGSIRMVLQNNAAINELLGVFRPRPGVMGCRYPDEFLMSRLEMANELAEQNRDILVQLIINLHKGDSCKRDGDASSIVKGEVKTQEILSNILDCSS